MTNFQSTTPPASHLKPLLPRIEPLLVDIVQAAVSQTVAMFVGTEPKCLHVEEAVRIYDGICGTISFVGDRSYSITMCCSRESAVELALAMAGFEIDYDSADMGDAIGEVANIIAGNIVARMEDQELAVAMSLPTVFRGHDVERILPHNMVSWCSIFELTGSVFWVDVIAGRTALMQPTQEICAICGR
ncbi:chemotaxis protein CheX [Armatimonas sp.]|uniref:chemotaxis protein CheX n=1 Tax=Armatimonas sp. TaxID=1872638 RepID=UPI003751E423